MSDERTIECPMCVSGFICVASDDAGEYGIFDVWETCKVCNGEFMISEADYVVLKLQDML